MKKIAIMQPYLFPYIGYWQLISAVDCFVIYDDVNYINKGWINRNNILLHGQPYKFTLPLKHASQNKKINEIYVCTDSSAQKKLLDTISIAYKHSPQYNKIFPIIEKIIKNEGKISEIIYISLQEICEYLEIRTMLYLSSNLQYSSLEYTAQEKILNIVHALGGDVYINPIGGQELYSKKIFLQNDVSLFFLKSNLPHYRQSSSVFIPSLSIIDVLMFNGKEEIQNYLEDYTLM